MVRAGSRRVRSEGYTLVALVIFAVVLSVLIAAVLPTVSTALQREKEEELIFRGLQYAEAIRVFQARNGRLPVSLEELIEIEPRALRQLWTDPMTEDGAWGLIYATAPGQSGGRGGAQGSARGGARGSSQPILSTSGTSAVGGSGAFASAGGAFDDDDLDDDDLQDDSTGSFGISQREQRIRRRAGLGGTLGGGPIVGVHSLSDDEAIKSFEGGSKYSDWKFTVELLPSGGPTGENVPRLNASFVGRPLPKGVEALADGTGLEEGGAPMLKDETPQERRERRRRERQQRREQRRPDRHQGGGGGD